MPVQASPPRRTTTSRPAGTTTARRPSSRAGGTTTARAAGQTRRVASTSADEGRRVASRAVGESQRVASTAKDQGQAVAQTAKDQGQAVARTAAEGAREVKGTVRAQAAQVRDEVAAQGRTVVDETRSKVQEQTGTQARRAAEGLSRLASEARALADGRPEEADSVRTYLSQGAEKLLEAADRIHGLADDVEARGIESVLDDLQRFARRRPGAFLLGAAVAGFGVGRVVRSAKEDDGQPAGDEMAPGRPAVGQPGAITGRRPRAVAAGRPAVGTMGAPTGATLRSAR